MVRHSFSNSEVLGLLSHVIVMNGRAQLRIAHVNFIGAEMPVLIRVGWSRHELTPPVGEFSMAFTRPHRIFREA